MNVMSIPGFTAEASLHNTNGRYLTVGAVPQTESSIQAAFRRGTNNCYYECLYSCDDQPYYCEENCRCLCSGDPHCQLQ